MTSTFTCEVAAGPSGTHAFGLHWAVVQHEVVAQQEKAGKSAQHSATCFVWPSCCVCLMCWQRCNHVDCNNSHLSSCFTPHGTHNQVWTAGTHPANHLTRGTDSLQQQHPTHRLPPAIDGIVQHPEFAATYSAGGGGALLRGEGGSGGMAKRTRQTCCS